MGGLVAEQFSSYHNNRLEYSLLVFSSCVFVWFKCKFRLLYRSELIRLLDSDDVLDTLRLY